MNAPLWFRLVHHWCQNGRTGLTVPLLVGADARDCGVPADPKDAERIVAEIRDYRSPGFAVRIVNCPDLRVPVVGTERSESSKVRIDLPEKWGREEEQILRALASDAAGLVKQGFFSRIGGYPNQRWDKLQPEDITLIDHVRERK
jgi:hypothetical protein